AKVWLLLLGLCAAQYFTVKEKDLAIHFYNASVLHMAAILGILVVLVERMLAEGAARETVAAGSGALLASGGATAMTGSPSAEQALAEASSQADAEPERASETAASPEVSAETTATARDEEDAGCRRPRRT